MENQTSTESVKDLCERISRYLKQKQRGTCTVCKKEDFITKTGPLRVCKQCLPMVELFNKHYPIKYDEYKPCTQILMIKGRPASEYIPPKLRMKVPELRKLAEAKGIPGYKKMKKLELQKALE